MPTRPHKKGFFETLFEQPNCARCKWVLEKGNSFGDALCQALANSHAVAVYRDWGCKQVYQERSDGINPSRPPEPKPPEILIRDEITAALKLFREMLGNQELAGLHYDDGLLKCLDAFILGRRAKGGA